MADDFTWNLLDKGFCSFKKKTKTQSFCRNTYNVTGLCNQHSCPLSNPRYATVLEKEGVLWLYMKTPERAHLPKKLWERVKLHKNYERAVAQIEENLQYWPEFMLKTCKQRHSRLVQVLQRMRKIKQQVRPKIVAINKKRERVGRKREAKALAAAQLDKAIEKELLLRLQTDTYGDMYNALKPEVFNKALDQLSDDEEEEFEDEEEDEEEVREFVEYVEESSDLEEINFEFELEAELDGMLRYEEEEEALAAPVMGQQGPASKRARVAPATATTNVDSLPTLDPSRFAME